MRRFVHAIIAAHVALALLMLLIALIALTGCQSEVHVDGVESPVPCIGILDEHDPRFVYKLSPGNLFVGILFAELIVPPVIVLVDETFCPVALKH